MGIDKVEFQDISTQVSPNKKERIHDKGLEMFFRPVSQEFEETIDKFLGRGLVGKAKKLGVGIYEPLPEYVNRMPFSFIATWEDRTLIGQIRDLSLKVNQKFVKSLSPETQKQVTKGKARTALQLDLVFTEGLVKSLKEGFLSHEDMDILYHQSKTELGTNTLSFLRLLRPIASNLDKHVVVVGKGATRKRQQVFSRLLKRYLPENRFEIQ